MRVPDTCAPAPYISDIVRIVPSGSANHPHRATTSAPTRPVRRRLPGSVPPRAPLPVIDHHRPHQTDVTNHRNSHKPKIPPHHALPAHQVTGPRAHLPTQTCTNTITPPLPPGKASTSTRPRHRAEQSTDYCTRSGNPCQAGHSPSHRNAPRRQAGARAGKRRAEGERSGVGPCWRKCRSVLRSGRQPAGTHHNPVKASAPH